MDFWDWKIWIDYLFVALHKYIFYDFLRISYKDSIYDIFLKKFKWKWKLTQKILWIFECKMDLTFKSPYHNHLLIDFNFKNLNMYAKR
jgi:hypothetical protein